MDASGAKKRSATLLSEASTMAEGISDCLKLLYELLQEADDASRLQAANIVYVLAGSMQVLQSKIDELDEDE